VHKVIKGTKIPCFTCHQGEERRADQIVVFAFQYILINMDRLIDIDRVNCYWYTGKHHCINQRSLEGEREPQSNHTRESDRRKSLRPEVTERSGFSIVASCRCSKEYTKRSLPYRSYCTANAKA